MSVCSGMSSVVGRRIENLSGKWEGWTKHGGGSAYYITGPDGIVLYYDITGTGYYGTLGQNNVSERPWTVQINRKSLRTSNDRSRVFGSKESARKAAENFLKAK